MTIGRRAPASVFALLFANAMVHAESWDSSYAMPSPLFASARPYSFSPANADGFWIFGGGLEHYHADGSMDFARKSNYADTGLSALSADGGVVFTSAPHLTGGFDLEFPCSLAAYSSDGNLRWQGYLPRPQGSTYCQQLGIDGSNVIWIKQYKDPDLYRFAADGAQLAKIDSVALGYAGFSDFVMPPYPTAGMAGPSVGGTYAVTAGTPSAIVALDQNAAIAWTWADSGADTNLQRIALGKDGNLYAAGRAGSAAIGSLTLVSVTPSGTLRFAHVLSDYQMSTVLAIAPAANGDFYLLTDQRTTATSQSSLLVLLRIGSDGAVKWSHVFNTVTQCDPSSPDCGLRTTTDDDVLVLATQPATGSSFFPGRHLLRYNSDGSELFDNSVITLSITDLPNGDALLTDTNMGLARIDRSGNDSQQAQLSYADVDAGFIGSQSFLAADGSSYLLGLHTQGSSLEKIASDGSVTWHVEDGTVFFSGGAVVAAGNRVCVSGRTGPVSEYAGNYVVVCYSSDTGAKVWSREIVASLNFFLRVLTDGSVLAETDSPTGAFKHQLFDPDGSLLHETAIPPGITGTFTMATYGFSTYLSQDAQHVFAFDRNAAPVYDLAFPPSVSSVHDIDIHLSDDGAALLTFDDESDDTRTATSYAWSIDANGATRWLQQLRAPKSFDDYTPLTFSTVRGEGDIFYILMQSQTLSSANITVFSSSIQARSASTGNLIWEDANVPSDTANSTLLQDDSTGHLLLIGRNARKLHLRTIDAGSGSILGERYETCPADAPPAGAWSQPKNYCAWNNFSLSSDGTLRADAFVANETNASRAQLFTLHHATALPPSIRIDQSGIAGAWYGPYETGQGFILDYIAGAGQIYMPWFTYSAAGGNDPAGLAWYTLQGPVVTGATSADLGIYITAPGAFDSGKVSSHPVGTAHLDFTDCSNGTLKYQFAADTNGGATGLISLQRITPATSSCTLADGSTLPATNANPPTQGFDARQSGSWYDPNISGQGIQFTIVPHGPNSAGLVFGLWFTFDPAGSADDANQQHWLSLQGDLSVATNGKVNLPIFRTIGGSFDATPTRNTSQVGTAVLTMNGCDKAHLDYQFDVGQIAHAFRRLSGGIDLLKIGGCSAP